MVYKLVVKDVIESNLAVSSEKAEKVFEILQHNVKSKTETTVDFSEIKSLTTAFLNVAIGELYRIEDREILNNFITIDPSTLSTLQKQKVKLVMENSRDKYSKSYAKRIEEVTIHGEAD